VSEHEDSRGTPLHRREVAPCDWDGVPARPYKPTGAADFRHVTRRVLFDAPWGLRSQVRCFTIGPGGYTTLERHHHVHAVIVLDGRGRVLVGREVFDVAPRDLVAIPPDTWHQLRATKDAPLSFLCIVDAERDRPVLPTPAELAELRRDPAVRAFLDGE